MFVNKYFTVSSSAINIIGGSNSTQGEFPWQILIRNSDPRFEDTYPYCGESLTEVNGTQVVITSKTSLKIGIFME